MAGAGGRMGNVVITGASGFVGKSLSRFLQANGHTVFPVSLRSPQWKQKMPPAITTVIHLAGLAHDVKNTRRSEEYFKINVGLTREVFDFFSESSAEKFIFFSSVKAVADRLGETVLVEDQVPRPNTAYGKSKLEAERYVLSRNPDGKKIYVLRPAMIHGPENKGNLNFLYRLISRGIPYPLAAFENERSFLSIENLNHIVKEICSRDIPAGVYNAADSGYLSTLDVVNMINAALGRKPMNWRVPPFIVRGLAGACGALGLPFSGDHLEKLTGNYKVSNEKIVRALGGELPVSPREGMMATIQSFGKK
jgi:nucleoside-diphosphate-sugar epimerase